MDYRQYEYQMQLAKDHKQSGMISAVGSAMPFATCMASIFAGVFAIFG